MGAPGSHDARPRALRPKAERSVETTQLEVILDALNKAAKAHGVHEAEVLGGVYDEQWAEWYAAHMLATFTAVGYTLTGPKKD